MKQAVFGVSTTRAAHQDRVAKLASRKAANFAPPVFAEVSASASLAKLTMCAAICTTVPMTIDQADRGGGLMEGNVLVKGNELVEGCATK